jgi:hypothetical protein
MVDRVLAALMAYTPAANAAAVHNE